MIVKKLGRPCTRCTRRFVPSGPATKICPKCNKRALYYGRIKQIKAQRSKHAKK